MPCLLEPDLGSGHATVLSIHGRFTYVFSDLGVVRDSVPTQQLQHTTQQVNSIRPLHDTSTPSTSTQNTRTTPSHTDPSPITAVYTRKGSAQQIWGTVSATLSHPNFALPIS